MATKKPKEPIIELRKVLKIIDAELEYLQHYEKEYALDALRNIEHSKNFTDTDSRYIGYRFYVNSIRVVKELRSKIIATRFVEGEPKGEPNALQATA